MNLDRLHSIEAGDKHVSTDHSAVVGEDCQDDRRCERARETWKIKYLPSRIMLMTCVTHPTFYQSIVSLRALPLVHARFRP